MQVDDEDSGERKSVTEEIENVTSQETKAADDERKQR